MSLPKFTCVPGCAACCKASLVPFSQAERGRVEAVAPGHRWTRRFVAGDTDPMPTTHRKLLLVYRNCALGAVSTPLTGTGTTASVPAISVANGGWTAGFIAARAAQSDMDTALLAGGLTTRREAANGSDVNSHAYADSNGPSVGFTQRDQTIASTAWFGVSFSLIRT